MGSQKSWDHFSPRTSSSSHSAGISTFTPLFGKAKKWVSRLRTLEKIWSLVLVSPLLIQPGFVFLLVWGPDDQFCSSCVSSVGLPGFFCSLDDRELTQKLIWVYLEFPLSIWELWWLILTVKLMGFRISMATNLRVDLKGIAYIRLTELNKRSPNITGIVPWTVVPAWVKRRRQTEHKHVLLSASWLWMWCDSPPNAVVPSLPGWAVSLDLGARINLPFIKLLLSGICHSDKTKNTRILSYDTDG